MGASASMSRQGQRPKGNAAPQSGIPEGVMIVILLVALGIVAFIGYLLWPRWPDQASPSDPGKLPISVGGLLMNVPREAFRIPVQRRTGTQDRIDLAFMYPSLAPPGPMPRVTAENAAQVRVEIDRIFLSVIAHGGAMSPDERRASIYARYFDGPPQPMANGLRRQGFRDASPYREEDLISAANSDFVARCSRDGATPGMCLTEKRIGGADLTFRFPRSWLEDWTSVAKATETLIAQLTVRPRS